jgi:fatty-acyl-CoA synthase
MPQAATDPDAPRAPSIMGAHSLQEIEARPLQHWQPASSMYGLLQQAAARHGDRPALTYLPSGDVHSAPKVTSYAQLLANVTRAANLFHALGVGPDDSVALMAPNMPETHFALWGAETVARACPINILLDAGHAAELMRAARAKVLVVLGPDPDLPVWSRVQELKEGSGVAHVLAIGPAAEGGCGVADFRAALLQQPADRLSFNRVLDRDTPAALFHTGGTTGTPKLAQHTHGNQLHTSWCAGLFYDLGPTDVMLNGFPLFHVAGAFVYGSACFAVGANQVLPTRLGMRNAEFIRNIWRFVERHRISVIGGVPTVLAGLMKTAAGDADINTWRLMLTGGSPLPAELAAAFEGQFRRPVRNIFGMTESAGLVTIEPALAPRVAGSTGMRLPYSTIKAVPVEASGVDVCKACAPGETGVIVLSGPHVGPGYTDPARNAGTFVDGWLVSGDLGHVDAEGRVFVTGRAKDVIIRGAHNIDPAEIEAAVSQHPAVEMCAAIGQPDGYAGELPVAYVTLKAGASATAEEVMAFANPRIADPPARVKRIEVVDAMPLTAIGKIYKPRLRQRATEWAFGEALASLGRQLKLRSLENNGAVAMAIVMPRRDAALEQAIRAALRDFAVPYTIVTGEEEEGTSA